MGVKRGDLSVTIGEFKALCKKGHLQSATQILHLLEEQGYKKSSYTYVCLLQGCTQSNALEEGKLIHGNVIKYESDTNIFIYTTIIHMYARCGSFEDARVVFDRMSERNLVTWSTMIEAYCQHERHEEALDAFLRMRKEGLVAC